MKTDKNYIKTLLLLMLLPFHLFAQEKVITLASPLPANGTTVYEAQQTIYLNPPFSYTASGSNTFTAKINESMIAPAAYITPVTINPRTLSSSLSVGTIAGSAGVGQSGAANYQMNITLPPGINGMQPAVSLVYNSQGGNGIAGWGFGIAGLSAVSRAPKTIYSDGTAAGILATPSAKFALDGAPLIAVTGANGADGAEYRMETENFSRIYSHGNFNNTGPDWFEVKTKDGFTLKYGNLTGKFKGTSGASTSYVQAWYLNRMENQDGVGVDYEYEASGMGLYLKKITYSGNTVEFFYDSRKDTIQVYLGSKTGFQDRILRKIAVRREGDLFRTYDLEYAFDCFSRLIRITEANGIGEKRNPTLFEWGGFPTKTNIGVKNVTVAASSLEPDFSKQYYSSVDLNGDGLTDLIGFFPYKKNNKDSIAIQAYIAKRDGDNIKFDVGSNTKDSITGSIDWVLMTSKYGGFLTGDIYGRGIQNVILPVIDGAQIKFYVFNNSSSFNTFFQTLGYSSELPEIAVDDVDGDGKCELLYIEKKPNKSNEYELNIGGDNKPGWDGKTIFTKLPLSIASKPDKMIVADFNGDGMEDIMVLTQDGYHIYWNQGGVLNNLFSASNKTVGTLFNSAYSEIEAGDFNGDGLPDFVLNEKGNANWYLAINQGNGVFSKKALPKITVHEEYFSGQKNDNDQCFATDFDGDGKSDIIISNAEYKNTYDMFGLPAGREFQTQNVYWYRSTGNDFEFVKSASYKQADANRKYFAFGDFKGMGSNQMLFYGYDCYNGQDQTVKWRLYDNAGLTAESGKIKGISDGLNNRTQFSYLPLTDPAIYTPAASSTYPVASLRGPLYAVAKMTQTNGVVSAPVVNKYIYMNGRIHLQGKGFLGFEQFKTTDSISQTTQVQDFGKIDPTYFYPVSNKISVLLGTDTISTSSGTNKVLSLGGKRIFPYADSSVQKDYLNGVTVTQIQAYNTDGNMTKSTVNYTNDATKVNEVVEVADLVYASYGGNGIANKVTTATQTRTYAGEPAFVAKQLYGYDAKGHLIKETKYANTTASLVAEYLNFNSLGLPAKMRDSTKDIVRETSFAYDTRGRVTSTTNPIGQVFKTSYDKWGRVATETDPLNLTTAHAYDNWDAETSVTYPDNTRETQLLAWSGSGGDVPSGALLTKTSTASGQPNVITYYDATGRELRTITYDAFNKKVYSDNGYNNKGQLEKTSLPYFSGNTVQWTTYAYLDDGRQKSETSLGLTTNYGYGKLTATVTPPDGHATTKTTNAKGDVVKVEELNRNGLIQYVYHSSGQPRSVTANGSTFTMEYDTYGRQSKLSDPNAGTINYTYYVSGELLTQTDARNNKTALTYDKLGRETTRTVTNGTKTVSVTNTVYNNYGIDSVKRDDMRLCYKYDSFGRILSQTEKSGADSYTTSYTYDANGMLQTRTFPSGYAVQYSYVNGMTTAIRKVSNNGAIWELTGANALGQITNYRNGGKFNVELGYDTYLNPTTKKLDGASYAEQAVNQLTGNLNSRKVGTTSESFGYDSQYRLTSWYGSSATYSDNGNILTKTGAGTYSYDPLRKHAVTGVTGVTGLNHAIAYNESGRATSIEEGAYRLTLDYGVDDQRVKTSLYENGTLIKEKRFASGYEKEIVGNSTREISYINAPSGLTAIVVRSAGIDSLFYVYTDHQGSILQLNSEAGAMVEQRRYDPWGRERDPNNWNNYTFNAGYRRTDRGYTGQEHLPQFGLINLNARLYDPLLGRFLSPDPYVQAPGLSQNYNRYSYCLNNPLIYTDPSGEKWWQWALGALLLAPVAPAVVSTAGTVVTTAGSIAAVAGGTAISTVMLAGSTLYTGASITSLVASNTLSAVDFNVTFWGTLFNGDSGWGGKRFNNWMMLDFQRINSLASTFRYDQSADGFEWPMQVINNLTNGEFLQDNIGNAYGHYLNISGKIDATGYYQGRLITRTMANTVNTGVSFGHYVFGDNIALSPNDNSQGADGLDLFAHEFGHTYQSRISGPLYLFKCGIASVYDNNGLTEQDASRRGFWNLGMTPSGQWKYRYEQQSYDRYRWYELGGAPMLWPFMWMWNY